MSRAASEVLVTGAWHCCYVDNAESINLAAESCIRCRRAMLTTDVPYKSALQKPNSDVMMALTTRSFVGFGNEWLMSRRINMH